MVTPPASNSFYILRREPSEELTHCPAASAHTLTQAYITVIRKQTPPAADSDYIRTSYVRNSSSSHTEKRNALAAPAVHAGRPQLPPSIGEQTVFFPLSCA
ncbi:unnamed protein product [Ixodes hexagonus]